MKLFLLMAYTLLFWTTAWFAAFAVIMRAAPGCIIGGDCNSGLMLLGGGLLFTLYAAGVVAIARRKLA